MIYQVIAKNVTTSLVTLYDIGITLTPNTEIDLTLTISIYDLSLSEDLLLRIANGTIQISDGTSYLSPANAIKYISFAEQIQPKDSTGKVLVHSTPRHLGTITYFTGAGDDINKPNNVGDGQFLGFKHNVGDPLVQSQYLDFNLMNKRMWIKEGYFNWSNCQFDQVSFSVVTRSTPVYPGNSTNYKLFNGYLVQPVLDATGNISINEDNLLKCNGTLVQIPDTELGIKPMACFFDARWDSIQNKFVDLTPKPNGDGNYNIFAAEVCMVKFVNKLCLYGTNAQNVNSADASQIGAGMRIKLDYYTHKDNSIPDHEWVFAGTFATFREL